MNKRKLHRPPSISCPHCGDKLVVRSSEQITSLSRELRLRCDNDACAAGFVAQIELIRALVQSLVPNPEVRLPFSNPNLGPRRARPANDDAPIPANDDLYVDGSLIGHVVIQSG